MGSIYLVLRMMKVDLFCCLRNRKLGKGGPRGRFGWHKQEQPDYTTDPPPKYDGYLPSEKKGTVNPQIDSFYSSPANMPLPPAAVSRAATLRRDRDANETLLSNPAPVATSAPVQTVPVSAMRTFYNLGPQSNGLSRQPSDGYGPAAGTQTTQNTYLTRQTSNAYDPNQREVNHLSSLSSLSSGFGDGLIIPEPVAGQAPDATRQSRKFSWMTVGSRGPLSSRNGDRDTVYTTASIETAPRFRTVNSWVAQQSGRVQRHLPSDSEVPNIPAIPVSHQQKHVRQPSEDPAFRQHPGEEIRLSTGARVPSAILNKKTGLFK